MYFPYFRGKQYELITVRDNASKFAEAGFVPIIEPVKESLGSLERALVAVSDAKGSAVVIVNPQHGDHADDVESISAFLNEKFKNKQEIEIGILLKEDISIPNILSLCNEHRDKRLTLVHAGFTHGKALAAELEDQFDRVRHVFLDDHCGKLYRKHFPKKNRVLVRDGFERRRNRDHPDIEFFSDLHATFEDEGMDGFGDFLTVGDDYSEGGGPAYAIAVHLTFIDDEDEAMYVYHFKSKRMDTPTDPAGKFAEALDAMIQKLDEKNSKVYESPAVKEFRSLHEKKHFPGLGYVKKLSMQHHIETIAHYFSQQ